MSKSERDWCLNLSFWLGGLRNAAFIFSIIHSQLVQHTSLGRCINVKGQACRGLTVKICKINAAHWHWQTFRENVSAGRGFFPLLRTCTGVMKAKRFWYGRQKSERNKKPQQNKKQATIHEQGLARLTLNPWRREIFTCYALKLKNLGSSNSQIFSFSGYFSSLAIYYYQSLSFTCLIPSDLVFYILAHSSFEAWIPRGLSPSASLLRREKYTWNLNWCNPQLLFSPEQKLSSKAETKTPCKVKYLMRLIQYNILKYDLLPNSF